MKTNRLTPAEYGRQLAEAAPPLTDEQVQAAARILATVHLSARAYTIAQAAELKSVSYDFVLRAVHATDARHLPAKRVGRGFRISAPDLEEWWSRLPDA